VRDRAQVTVRTSRGITTVNDTVFSGTLIGLHRYENYLNGREHGIWKTYFTNNQLSEVREYDHGRKTGVYRSWWENGQLRSEYHFEDNEYNGACMDWSPAGQLIRKMNYVNGYETGRQQMWDDDGTIRANYVAKNGRNYGLTGVKNCVSKF
jgi:antitoxin component YwqK of YwqJK toxin-antitoxin module